MNGKDGEVDDADGALELIDILYNNISFGCIDCDCVKPSYVYLSRPSA